MVKYIYNKLRILKKLWLGSDIQQTSRGILFSVMKDMLANEVFRTRDKVLWMNGKKSQYVQNRFLIQFVLHHCICMYTGS